MRINVPEELSPYEINCLLANMASPFDHDRIATGNASKVEKNRIRLTQFRLYPPYLSISYTKRRIFGRGPLCRAASGCIRPGSNRRFMQQEISLYNLQANQFANAFAVVDNYRILVDNAQAVVHFYKGRDEWGNLVRSLPVEKWSGDWLIRTIGRFFRINYQLDQDKAMATIQQNGYLRVVVAHRIGEVAFYKRMLLDALWDYGVVYRGEIGCDATVRGAIAKVRKKLSLRDQGEQSAIVLRVGAGSRFTHESLADFCAINGLELGGQYSKQQVRQSVLRKRKLNCEQYRDQLNYFGININCR